MWASAFGVSLQSERTTGAFSSVSSPEAPEAFARMAHLADGLWFGADAGPEGPAYCPPRLTLPGPAYCRPERPIFGSSSSSTRIISLILRGTRFAFR